MGKQRQATALYSNSINLIKTSLSWLVFNNQYSNYLDSSSQNEAKSFPSGSFISWNLKNSWNWTTAAWGIIGIGEQVNYVAFKLKD